MPPLSHPSLPARPTAQTTSNRPPSTYTPAPPASFTPHPNPLSLPNRPNAPPTPLNSSSSSRPPLNSSTSSFSLAGAASPKLSASTSSSQAGGKDHSSGGVGDSPWPRVRERITSDQVKVNSELIELGQGWVIKYRCWKGSAIPLSNSEADYSNYDPFLPPVPSTSASSSTTAPTQARPPLATSASSVSISKGKEKEEGPAKKKAKTQNPLDELLSEELGSVSSPLLGPPSLPPTPLSRYQPPVLRTDTSTSKLDDQIKTLRSSRLGIDEDPFERARRDLIQRGKEKVREGGDRLDLLCYIKVSSAQLEVPKKESNVKGKGKEREDVTREKVEGAGRVLWAFGVIRSGEAEAGKTLFDDLNYDGLECVSSGSFSHQTLYPALYPPSTNSTSTPKSSGFSPLARPAQSYPSALAISSNFLSSLPSVGPPLRQTDVAVAYESFLASVEDTLIAEIIASSRSSGHKNGRTWQRIGRSLVYLPPPSSCDSHYSNSTPSSPRKRHYPSASASTFRLTIQRSTIFVQTAVEELPYQSLPSRLSSTPIGYPILLAPLGIKAKLVRRIHLSDDTSDKELEQMRQRWRKQLDGIGLEIESNDWVTCRLDFSSSSDDVATTTMEEGEELVWPAELVVIDGTRPPPPPTPQSSPDKPAPTELSPAMPPDSIARHSSLTSPGATFPPPPVSTPDLSHSQPSNQAPSLLPFPYDSSARRKLAAKALGRSRRRDKLVDGDETINFRRDPLAGRTNEVWRWMEDETTRRATEAEEKLAREKKALEEEEERKKVEEAEKGKAKGTRQPPPAAAPINMRTPMSLGTSSTEAPSPADVVFPLPGYTTAVSSTQTPSFPQASDHHKPTGNHSMEIDGLGLGLYPSPEEPPHSTQPSNNSVSTSQPMTSLDNAFASFDWGDGSYGTSNGAMGAATGNQDYDDGMDLLDLNDDDFSFFDTAPTPLPGTTLAPSTDMGLSVMQDPYPLAHSTTTSPKFVDHFSHLSTTPFASSTSPTSPYATHTSPHFAIHSSPVGPATNHFAFDTSANALGLAAPTIVPSSAAIMSTPTSLASPTRPDSIPVPSFSVSLSDRPSFASTPQLRRCPLPGAFDALHFSPSYDLVIAKYDSRQGKFGLPTPESDEEELGFDHKPIQDSSTSSTSLEPWYTSICDPRIAVAERLQRDRRSKEGRGRSNSRGRSLTSTRHRGWKRAISKDEYSDGTVTADEDTGDGSDIEMDETEQQQALDDQRPDSDGSTTLVKLGGLELLVLGDFANRLIKRQIVTPEPILATTAVAAAQEVLLSVLIDHIYFNREFRSTLSGFIGQSHPEPKLVSNSAIKDISDSLSSVCSTLSPSPLFADHTALSPLETATSPSLLLRSQQSVLQVATTAMEFWKPMGFEPIIGRKDVTAFAIYEEAGTTMHDLIDEWLKDAASIYQGLRLGEHATGVLPSSGQFGGTQDGHLALPAGSLTRGYSKEDSKILSMAIVDVSKLYQNVVFYIISPEGVAPLTTSSPLFTLLHLLQRSKPALSSIVSIPISTSQLYREETSCGRTSTERHNSLAFSLYDQLQVPVTKLRFPISETFPSAAAALNPANQSPNVRLFQSPAVTISPIRPRKISFDMNFPVSTLAIQQRHRFLHVGYTSKSTSADGLAHWVYVSTVDETGESWRSVNRFVKVPPGVPGDVLRVRLVWSLILQLLQGVDVEWRIVVCRLDEPTILEIRAWDSILKEQLVNQKRPVHVTFVSADLNPPLSILPSNAKVRRSSVQSDTLSEEGELTVVSRPSSSHSKLDSPALFDKEPTILSFTPSEPVSVLSSLTVFAPASTYLIHVPRIPTFTHSSIDSSIPPFSPLSPSSISIHAIHFLLSHASRTSSYSAPLSDLVKDVRQSYTELSALARVRWGTNGRLPWHLEAVKMARDLGTALAQRQDT